MNPIFVAAVKRNQIGVHPQESLFVSTPPGTIPATVRPPRIPELADAPIMNDGVIPTQAAGGAEVPSQRMAIAEPTPTPSQPASKPTGFFGSLFSSKSDKPEEKAEQPKSGGAIDRMARLVGLKKDTPKTADAAPAAKPKPAAKPTSVAAHGAIRPTESAKAAEPAKTQQATAAAAPPAPASTAMSGAAPVVPTGSFDTRWSAMR